MGQFKPMVKMETTEPTVELKLKKGGHVNMKKGGKAEAGHKKMAMGGGGAMDALAGTPALIGRPAVNAPIRAPGKPSMAARRKAMMAKPAVTPSGPSMAPPPMKKGGKAEGGKSDKAQDKAMIKKAFKQHDSQEHKGGKGTSLKLKKGGKGYATGGVIDGQGGYKNGGIAKSGIINTENQGGKYRNTLMHTAEYTGKSSGKTGGVKDGNGGGYKTGGVALGNGGGYKMGGKTTKKAYATGGTVNSGKPVAMSQGRKPVPAPVRISQLSGTYKNGGRATPAEARLLRNNAAENASAMRDANMNSNLKYGSPKRMAEGGRGSVTDFDADNYRNDNPQAKREQEGYDRHYADEARQNKSDRDAMYDALMYIPRKIKGAFGDLTGQGSSSDKERSMLPSTKGMGSVTEREKSITVSPARKKHGGRAC
jgi:hypothetical protein